MITSVEIAWVAGLLEGEGCFTTNQTTPVIMIKMTDLDTIEKFRIITKTMSRKIGVVPHEKYKTRYTTNVHGTLAVQWMMTVYVLMSIRRKERIREILSKYFSGWKPEVWRAGHQVPKTEGGRNRRLVKLIMMSRNVTKEEAEEILKKGMETIQ